MQAASSARIQDAPIAVLSSGFESAIFGINCKVIDNNIDKIIVMQALLNTPSAQKTIANAATVWRNKDGMDTLKMMHGGIDDTKHG